jgi:hypothetical protein
MRTRSCARQTVRLVHQSQCLRTDQSANTEACAGQAPVGFVGRNLSRRHLRLRRPPPNAITAHQVCPTIPCEAHCGIRMGFRWCRRWRIPTPHFADGLIGSGRRTTQLAMQPVQRNSRSDRATEDPASRDGFAGERQASATNGCGACGITYPSRPSAMPSQSSHGCLIAF